MRQVPGSSRSLAFGVATAACVLASAQVPAAAQGYGYGGYPYPVSYYNNQSVQYGLNLPQVPVSNGSDEIRAADGTTCKSSISGNGPVLDVGMLGNQDFYGSFASGTVYGRVVMPLGEQPRRLDCTGLYKLEIERLQHELKLVKMGMSGKGAGVAESGGAGWQNEGWSQTPRPTKLGSAAGAPAPAGARQPARGADAQSMLRPDPAQQAPVAPSRLAPATPARSETARAASPGPWGVGAADLGPPRAAVQQPAEAPPVAIPPAAMPVATGAAGWGSTVTADPPPTRRAASERGGDWVESFWSTVR